MAEMDQGLKWLIDKRLDDLIALALPGAVCLGPLPTDVASGPQLLPDRLHKIHYYDLDCAVNIEIQAYPDKTMARRMFEYGTRVDTLYDLPVFSVVLWVHKKGGIPQSPYVRRVGPHVLATWSFINIDVRKLSASAMVESGGLGILPLVPFMQGANKEILTEAMRRLKEKEAEEDTRSLTLLLVDFIARRHSASLATSIYERFFMGNIDFMKESPLYPILTKEARVDGEREMAQIALEGRFKTVSEDVLTALKSADEATLRAIVANISTDTLEQIRARLGLSATQG